MNMHAYLLVQSSNSKMISFGVLVYSITKIYWGEKHIAFLPKKKEEEKHIAFLWLFCAPCRERERDGILFYKKVGVVV